MRVLRIHFTADDLARVRFAPRPAPLQELHAALTTAVAPRAEPLFGPWRGRVLRTLPAASAPLADLVPAGRPPSFLDAVGDTLAAGFEHIRSTHPDTVRSELERVYGAGPAPRWLRALHAGEETAWRTVRRAQRAAYETVLAPVWPLVQDLHRDEFARHALSVAEHGLSGGLTALAPGSRFHAGVWEWPGVGEAAEAQVAEAACDVAGLHVARAAGEGSGIGVCRSGAEIQAARDGAEARRARDAADTHAPRDAPGIHGSPADTHTPHDIHLAGRGLLLLPTFHHPAGPLVQDLPGRPVVLTYPAGPGLPLVAEGPPGRDEALAPVLGRTRAELLRLLGEPHTTTDLARALRVSNATASAHAAALRGAGLVTTRRTGRSVTHERTALGTLLVAHDGP
ncbi:helix-turn-helix domain-containing protein [Streptomyces sp. NPDC094032]|uniref:helix-turn-helix domain-containing protein n=1 Tax=Streptomyces sp. NPDC094032 TaxID=3155308 RepID=UPI003327A0A5